MYLINDFYSIKSFILSIFFFFLRYSSYNLKMVRIDIININIDDVIKEIIEKNRKLKS